MPKPELSEKDFIHEGYESDPRPFWFWLLVLMTISAFIWGISTWYQGKLNHLVEESPFLQVTNRDISLFLWQNPEFMRNNVKEKLTYLPAFQYIDKVTIDAVQADQYAIAPPEVLFRYHTWDRLIKGEFIETPIPRVKFIEFLSYAEEWDPAYWPKAPNEYVRLVKELSSSHVADLSILSKEAMPDDVRIAFQGWTNYFYNGQAINQMRLTGVQVREFLVKHPNFARNYWINILEDSVPDYLQNLNGEAVMDSDQFAPFLKVALFNAKQKEKVKG